MTMTMSIKCVLWVCVRVCVSGACKDENDRKYAAALSVINVFKMYEKNRGEKNSNDFLLC